MSARHALEALAARAPLDSAAIDAFIAAREFPIVEGPRVTFVYRGAAEAVHLKHWVYGLSSAQSFTRLADSDLWVRTVELPPGSRVEYKLEVVGGGHSRWMEDPLNPRRACDPFGANSVCFAQGYSEPDWAREQPDAPRGHIDTLRVDSRVLGDERTLSVYLPAGFSERRRRHPLLVLHDGDDYLRYSALATVLDNLIHRLEIPELIVALSNPSSRRIEEYAAGDDHARHLVEELVPALEARYPIHPSPARRALGGASLGAVASLYTAWRYPRQFGRLLLQSGTFTFADIGEHGRGRELDPVARFVSALRENPRHPADRVFVSCGVYESLIYHNRSLVPMLQATEMRVRYVEAKDGHNWHNWRDRLRDGLSYLFGSPLWWVY